MNELELIKHLFSYDKETDELKQRGKKVPFYIEILQFRHDGKKRGISRARVIWVLTNNRIPTKPICLIDRELKNPYVPSNLIEGRAPSKKKLLVSHNSNTGYSCVRWLCGRVYKQKSFTDETAFDSFIKSFGKDVVIKYEKHKAMLKEDI